MTETMVLKSFAFTDEYFRFMEFCTACEKNRYIGLCYGPPGVGKTLSARRYTQWDELEQFDPNGKDAVSVLAQLDKRSAVLFTPAVTNTPSQIELGIQAARGRIYNLREERIREHHEPQIDDLREKLSAAARDQDRNRDMYEAASNAYHRALDCYRRMRDLIPKPNTSLVIIDEADRLRMASLEQVRAVFDRSEVGVILIGMPGIEKRLARYPQLYSRVGFVHEFRPLSKLQVLSVLRSPWRPHGVLLPVTAFDEDSFTAIVRITLGNFRLLHRLLTQIARVMEINELERVTAPVVDAARESLVIGTA